MTFPLRARDESAARWDDLVAELDCWAQVGRRAKLWWRDDDAAAETAALTRLLSLPGDAPLALAVIPAFAEPSLFRLCESAPRVFFLQHGWRHENRAAAGEKKSEFPADRPPALVSSEIARGRDRLLFLFGERALKVFVPPWNRFAKSLLPFLRGCGIAAISAFGPGRGALCGLSQENTHLDLVAWQGGRGFIGEEAALSALCAFLEQRRRSGREDAIGILTHHLLHTADTDAFLARLLPLLRLHRGARWLSPKELFAPAAAGMRGVG